MADVETNGSSESNESKHQLAKSIQSDVVCQTDCSFPETQAIEVKLSDGSVMLRFTPKPSQASKIEKSTS